MKLLSLLVCLGLVACVQGSAANPDASGSDSAQGGDVAASSSCKETCNTWLGDGCYTQDELSGCYRDCGTAQAIDIEAFVGCVANAKDCGAGCGPGGDGVIGPPNPLCAQIVADLAVECQAPSAIPEALCADFSISELLGDCIVNAVTCQEKVLCAKSVREDRCQGDCEYAFDFGCLQSTGPCKAACVGSTASSQDAMFSCISEAIDKTCTFDEAASCVALLAPGPDF